MGLNFAVDVYFFTSAVCEWIGFKVQTQPIPFPASFQRGCPAHHCQLALSRPEASGIQTTVEGRGQAIDDTEGNAAEEGRCHRGWLHLSDFIPFLALTILNPVQEVGEGR